MNNKALMILSIVLLNFSAFAQQKYVLDIKKSKILWKLETMGKHNGYILFKSGTLNYAASKPKGGVFVIDMSQMRSEDGTAATIKRVEGELKMPNFFNVNQYPTSTMVVKQIVATKNPQLFQISGDLTIKGITKPISFVANLKKQGRNVVVSAQLKIDRRKWNIAYKPKNSDLLTTWKDKLLQEDIDITLNLVFNE